MNEDNLISVIIPLYNSEKTICRTLDSVINQTYKKIEIIIIDDGSTDRGGELCQKYTENDSRIILIKQKNQGVGAARNNGINHSKGKYISFIDSDDVIDLNFFSELLSSIIKYNADVVGSNICVNLGENKIYPYGNKSYDVVYRNDEIKINYLNFDISTAVWGKLYRRDLIKDIKFEKININEDFIYSWELIKKAKLFVQNYNTSYIYNLNVNNSLSKSCFSVENMSMFRHIKNVIKDSLEMSKEIICAANNYYYACALHTFILYYDYLKTNPKGELYIQEKSDMIKILKQCPGIKNGLLIQETNVDIKKLINDVNSLFESIHKAVNK